MNTNRGDGKMDVKERISKLWIVVMFNMAFADILTFMLEYSNDLPSDTQATQALMLIAAIIVEIPILMIILSRVLSDSVNRWANLVAGIITILFVVGGGSGFLHYLFFASVEVVCALLIIWYAWRRWPNPESWS